MKCISWGMVLLRMLLVQGEQITMGVFNHPN